MPRYARNDSLGEYISILLMYFSGFVDGLQNTVVASIAFIIVVVIIPTMNNRQIIKQLEADGWILRGVKGSHHVYTHPGKPGHISVPHPKHDLGVGLVHKLLTQAGLK